MNFLECDKLKLFLSVFKVFLASCLILSFGVFSENSVLAEEVNEETQENNDVFLQAGTYDESSVIVKYKDSVKTGDVCELAGEITEDSAKIADNTVKLDLEQGQSASQVIAELQENPNVEYVEPNYLLTFDEDLDYKELSQPTEDATLSRTYINDPYQVYQWQLSDSISKVYDAWDLSKCNRNVTVAVLDSGIDATHPDLKNNVIGGKSFVGSNPLRDANGHGTGVAGMISSQSNNGIGTSGVSYNAKLFSLQCENGSSAYVSDVVKAINWMVDNNSKYGIRIINISLGSYNYTKSLENAINRAYNAGILCVCGSGNDGYTNKCMQPASYANTLAVGAVGSNHRRASWSNGGSALDVVAPGAQIATTGINNKYVYESGTSFSAPFVSGVAALCIAINGELTPAELKNCITSTATHLGSSGKNNEYGYGQVNTYSAVNKAKSLKKSVNTMYRMYNSHTGEHFYTKDTNEKYNLITAGWKYEGVGWYAPKSSKTSVYRLYNPYVSGGDHYYTTSNNEKNSLVKAGWRYEGIGWYSDNNKKVPVYQQYNKYAKTGTHNYTTSKSENDKLVKAGWKAEGIAWYGVEFRGNYFVL